MFACGHRLGLPQDREGIRQRHQPMLARGQRGLEHPALALSLPPQSDGQKQRRRGQGRREHDLPPARTIEHRGRQPSGEARPRRHRGRAHREPGQLPLQPAHLPQALLAAREVLAEGALLIGLERAGDERGAVLDVPVVRIHRTQSLIGASATRSLSKASRSLVFTVPMGISSVRAISAWVSPRK